MLKARDIMTSRVITIQALASVAEALDLMRKNKVHELVVERSGPDDAYGIVTDEDIVYNVLAEGEDPAAVQVYEVMMKPCVVINPDLGVEYRREVVCQRGHSLRAGDSRKIAGDRLGQRSAAQERLRNARWLTKSRSDGVSSDRLFSQFHPLTAEPGFFVWPQDCMKVNNCSFTSSTASFCTQWPQLGM